MYKKIQDSPLILCSANKLSDLGGPVSGSSSFLHMLIDSIFIKFCSLS